MYEVGEEEERGERREEKMKREKSLHHQSQVIQLLCSRCQRQLVLTLIDAWVDGWMDGWSVLFWSKKTSFPQISQKLLNFFFLFVFRPLRQDFKTFSVKKSAKKSNFFFQKKSHIYFFSYFIELWRSVLVVIWLIF